MILKIDVLPIISGIVVPGATQANSFLLQLGRSVDLKSILGDFYIFCNFNRILHCAHLFIPLYLHVEFWQLDDCPFPNVRQKQIQLNVTHSFNWLLVFQHGYCSVFAYTKFDYKFLSICTFHLIIYIEGLNNLNNYFQLNCILLLIRGTAYFIANFANSSTD